MTKIEYMIDKSGNLVINASWDGNSYGAVVIPRCIVNGRVYLSDTSINTDGLDNPSEMKDEIINYITTHRGKYNEEPIIVEKQG